MERTYIMLKPDACERKLTGKIIDRIESKGYLITNMKMMYLSDEIISEHYGHLKSDNYPKGTFDEVKDFMKSGPVIAMIVEGNNVITGMRTLMGSTKEENRIPGTIRFDYSTSTQNNLMHGSDSKENAEIEIKRFFG